MKYITNTLNFHVDTPSVITLGKFDGLHRGHELLMETMLTVSRRQNLSTIVFTFDIPPKNAVENVNAKVLTTNEEKHLLFEKNGVDYLIECPFTPEVMHMLPEAFIRWIVRELNVKVIVAGKDFCFGSRRSGNYRTLQQYEEELGYRAIILEKVQEEGRDISSTYVREEIAAGHIEKANHMLGYPYFLTSQIVHGRRIGHTIGIPTINMILPEEKLLPPFGVYVTRVLVGEEWYTGVSNVGRKPTVGDHNPVGVETYLIDFCQDVYGAFVTLQFLTFIRPEMKFESLDALKYQMSCDIATARDYFRRKG